MKKRIIILSLSVILGLLTIDAQEFKYYKDKWGSQEVPSKNQSKYYKRITKEGELVTTEFLRTKDDQLLDFMAYKGKQPYLVWKRFDKKGNKISELNYEFDLDYSDEKPENVVYIDLWKNELEGQVEGTFEKPILKGYDGYSSYLVKTLRYPRHAQRMGIQGKVTLLYKISKDGKGTPISVIEGTEVHLDKEAARVLRETPQWEPAKLNSKPIDVYAVTSISFKFAGE